MAAGAIGGISENAPGRHPTRYAAAPPPNTSSSLQTTNSTVAELQRNPARAVANRNLPRSAALAN